MLVYENLFTYLFCIWILGVPWTEEEHRLFLVGLQKLGKGDWRGIARNYVVSRTPTQVASHAQKYFIRQTNATRRKRRSSLFDMVRHASLCYFYMFIHAHLLTPMAVGFNLAFAFCSCCITKLYLILYVKLSKIEDKQLFSQK